MWVQFVLVFLMGFGCGVLAVIYPGTAKRRRERKYNREERKENKQLKQQENVAGGLAKALRRQLDKKKFRVDKPFLEGEQYYFYAYALFRGGYAQVDGPRVKVTVRAADKEVSPISWMYQDGFGGDHHTLVFPNGFDRVAGRIAEYLKSLRENAVHSFGE
jgi:hypothetical protein